MSVWCTLAGLNPLTDAFSFFIKSGHSSMLSVEKGAVKLMIITLLQFVKTFVTHLTEI